MTKTTQNTPLNVPVAIIGMGCLFPKSPGLKAYWQLLVRGRDAITDIPETHWPVEAYFNEDPKKPDHVYCKRGAFLPSIAFDPAEFGIPPSSLEATDTSQLLALMTAKNALDDAGYGSGKAFNRERTSVVLGVTGTQELVIPLGSRLGHPVWRKAILEEGLPEETAENIVKRISDSYVPWHENSFPGLLGNVVAGRICNRLDLGGTNCVVDAACASSMSAVLLALLELQAGRSDMVITGGVDAINDIFMHMCFSKTLILSKTGDIRPFSKDADGTLLGEGIGMFVLKRLSDAKKDDDNIYAVIKAIGSSSDGKSQSIYAPRAEGQANALSMAYENAQIDPATIGLVEAHGTGTRVGDKVELNALKQVYGNASAKTQQTAIGTVKSMIGHTKAAAGAAGLIKAALALKNKVLPPTLKAENPDPELNLKGSPFYINSEVRPWISSDGHPRRSGVSSFGFGGSNFHIVLEEYASEKTAVSWDGSVEIFAFSARDRQGIARELTTLKRSIDPMGPEQAIDRPAAESRHRFSGNAPCRLLFVHEATGHQTTDLENLRSIIESAATGLENTKTGHSWNLKNIFYAENERPGKLAFVFPGQGSQYPGMGCDIVCAFPEGLNALEKVNKICACDPPVTDAVFPLFTAEAGEKKRQEETLNQTDVAQPAIGGISLAMIKVLDRFGLKPDAACGHSFGELTALHAAGWIDEDTFVGLSAARGRAMAEAVNAGPEGTMLAVKAPLKTIETLIQGIPGVILANMNSPEQGVLSGPIEGIAWAETVLKKNGFKGIRLPVSAAFHSSLIQAAQEPFGLAVQSADLRPTDIPVFSNTSGKSYETDIEKAKTLLSEQMLNPVHFVSAIENLYAAGIRTFVEVGPKAVLTGLVKSILAKKTFQAVSMDASAGKRFGLADLARTLAQLAALGHPVSIDAWEDQVPNKKKQRMTVMLNGANYRSKKSVTPAKARTLYPTSVHQKRLDPKNAPLPGSLPHQQPPIDPTTTLKPSKILNATTPKNISPKKPMKNNDKTHNRKSMPSSFVENALQTVTEGLKSMQALQTGTAEAHQKFLETQADAGRTLQQMMESTQRLAEASLGVSDTFTAQPVTTVSMAKSTSDPMDTPSPLRKPETGQTDTIVMPSPQLKPPLQEADASALRRQEPANLHALQPAHAPAIQSEALSSTLLRVVSELTGYPTDMLNMDMDIEADLGIDSIKRVEILSTLEEKMPGIPSMEPDMMARLKTLGQIAEYLMGSGAIEQTPNAGWENPPPPPEPPAPSTVPMSMLSETILEVVSLLTGYPTDMLDMNMDIEADLGIDSIKRVEILSALEEKMPDLPSVSADLMGSLKTLGQIAEYLIGGGTEETASPISEPKPHRFEPAQPNTQPREAAVSLNDIDLESHGNDLDRKAVEIQETPRTKVNSLSFQAGRQIYVLEESTGFAKAIVDAFRIRGIETALLTRDRALEILEEGQTLPDAAGLVILSDEQVKTDREGDRFLKIAFQLSKAAAPGLMQAGQNGSTLFATITKLDGAFGFRGRGIDNPVMGGLGGLLKTAAIEWKGVTCRSLDIDPEWNDLPEMAKRVAVELLEPVPSEPLEIGLTPNHRYTLALNTLPPFENQNPQTGLGSDDVIVITGGARGVTAASAIAFARLSGSTLILMGRSAAPSPEPMWLHGLTDPAQVKKAILEKEFNDNGASLGDIEHAFIRHMANREIHETLRCIEEYGAAVRYISADIRNLNEVDEALEKVRSTFGPITAIIHGAGVIEDRLIVDKTPKQFDRVYDTKVKGLRNLIAATQNDPLKHMVLFSSITARVGNTGQVDYAMANEVLNKIAWQISLQRPDCRTLSINWGPWDGGMVTPALKRAFQKQNIGLIPLESGAQNLQNEMGYQHDRTVEIVIGSAMPPQQKWVDTAPRQSSRAQKPPTPKPTPMSLTFKREIDTIEYPILQSHVIGGKPVVPFALITEWFGHGALHENPGLVLHGIDDMRILKGVKIDAGKKMIRLFAGKPSKKGQHYEVSVELRDGMVAGMDVIHSRGRAILTDSIPEPPAVDLNLDEWGEKYPKSMQEVYHDILFHGIDLHGIKEILTCSPRGMTARISSAPSPAQWIKDPLRSGWIADPLALDSAFQMAIVWCYEETGNISLPSYCASYRQYCSAFPSDSITALLEVTGLTDHKMTGNYTLIDKNNRLVAKMTGYEAVIDASLYKASKTQLS